jgi:DNA invertase Pin-like site-specific DNA recombinase
MTDSQNKPRVAMYVRLARMDIHSHRHLDWQRERCRSVAEQYGLRITDEYCDIGASASRIKRPALRQMLNELTTKNVHYVIVTDLARLSRNMRDLRTITAHLTQDGAELIVCDEDATHASLWQDMAEGPTSVEEDCPHE